MRHDELTALDERDCRKETGFTISEILGWLSETKPGLDTLAALAELGILAAPGTFYEGEGSRHVRLALTATDERISQAAARLRASAL